MVILWSLHFVTIAVWNVSHSMCHRISFPSQKETTKKYPACRDESGVGHAFARIPTHEYEVLVVCGVNTGTVYSRRVRAVH